jgi:hypothetical protein
MTGKQQRELILHLNRTLQDKIYPHWQEFIRKEITSLNNDIKEEFANKCLKIIENDIDKHFFPWEPGDPKAIEMKEQITTFLKYSYPLIENLFKIEQLAHNSAKRITSDILSEIHNYEKQS